MPTNVVKTEHDERLWKKAKEQAKKQGREDDYDYIMGIFQRMKGKTSKESAYWELGYQHAMKVAFGLSGAQGIGNFFGGGIANAAINRLTGRSKGIVGSAQADPRMARETGKKWTQRLGGGASARSFGKFMSS